MSEIIFNEGSSPSTPSSNKITLYGKANGFLYSKDDTGVELQISGSSPNGHGIEISGSLVTQRPYLNLIGDSFSIADNPANTSTDVTSIAPAMLNGVTVTVKPGGGGDYTTIQGAIDYFKNKVVYGTNYITIDPGTYAEALIITNIDLMGTLRLQGDTRVIPGIAYMHEAAVGYTTTNGGVGTVSLSRSASPYKVLTVTTSTCAVDFTADSITAGDVVMSYTGLTTNTVTENILTDVSSTTLTGTNAWDSGVGTSGSASTIIIEPNVVITPSAATCITISSNGVGTIILQGLTLKVPSLVTNGISITNSFISMTNVIVYGGYYGTLHGTDCNTSLTKYTGINNTIGFYASSLSVLSAQYITIIKSATHGYYMLGLSYADIISSKIVKCGTTGCYAYYGANIKASGSFCRGNTLDNNPVKNAAGNANSFITA